MRRTGWAWAASRRARACWAAAKFSAVSASLSASYEIDFWGKYRDAALAADETAVASRFDRDVVQLTTLVGVANAYDAMMMTALAIKAAGSTDGPKVRDGFYKIGRYEGLVDAFLLDSGRPGAHELGGTGQAGALAALVKSYGDDEQLVEMVRLAFERADPAARDARRRARRSTAAITIRISSCAKAASGSTGNTVETISRCP